MLEVKGIRWSLAGAFIFGVLGISFSIGTNSQAIFLDEYYNLDGRFISCIPVVNSGLCCIFPSR
ncbi:MAG TPA: hypothetical protein DDX98_12070 [Bacteroidales bacterium]|jgi:predicted Co/Zn/Cd cation transporter (cation efflux family)|nr:hypothetical protein [Bacteroidales bacterium]